MKRNRSTALALDLLTGAVFGLIMLTGLVTIGILAASHARSEPIALDGATIETAFAPGDEPARLVAAAIGEATREVRVMTYQLTSGRIVNALRFAAARGIDVKVIVDEATCEARRFPPVADVLTRAGVEVTCDGKHPIHHNKVVIVDGVNVVTGSFNFSPSAERNAENTNVLRNVPHVAAAYLAVWAEHRAHSVVRGR